MANSEVVERMRELQIEDYLVDQVEALGGLAYKFTSPGRRSVPDRLVLLPGGVQFFVELKSPYDWPTAAQKREHTRLRKLGAIVFVARSKGAVDAILAPYQPKRENQE